MNSFTNLLILSFFGTLTLAATIENPENNYILEIMKQNQFGNNEGSISAIPGYDVEEKQSFDFSVTKNVPYTEILKLIESFIRLKGEVASRIHHLLLDNSELIRVVWNTVISKVSSLHSFTLAGIVILRKVLEFAATLFGQWSVNFGVGQAADAFGYSSSLNFGQF